MAEGLPEGLVRNREGITAVEEGVDRVEVDLVASCWTVYSSNKAILAENIGRRLENFFWRIWSSERLRQRLTGTQVNILFEIINQGGYIRTTPTSSPRSSKGLRAYYKEAQSRTPPSTPSIATQVASQARLSDQPETSSRSTDVNISEVIRNVPDPSPALGGLDDHGSSSNPSTFGIKAAAPRKTHHGLFDDAGKARPLSSHEDYEDSSLTPTPTSPLAALEQSSNASKENRRTPSGTARRPPILKKESSGSSRSSKSAKIALASGGESEIKSSAEDDKRGDVADNLSDFNRTRSSSARRPTATRFNEEVAVSIPKPSSSVPRIGGEPWSRAGESSQRPGRRHPIVASNAANRTKPSFIRQKSSIGTTRDAPYRSSSAQNLARSPKSALISTSQGSRSQVKLSQSPKSLSAERSRAASPHPSKRRTLHDVQSSKKSSDSSGSELNATRKFIEEPTHNPTPIEGVSANSPSRRTGETKPLVDPKFRAQFIDRTRASQRSMTDLSALTRKSTAATPTTASFQAAGLMDRVQATSSAGSGKGREAFTNVTAPLKAPAPAGPEGSDDDQPLPLRRTKSQLTMLLEKDKEKEGRKTDKQI